MKLFRHLILAGSFIINAAISPCFASAEEPAHTLEGLPKGKGRLFLDSEEGRSVNKYLTEMRAVLDSSEWRKLRLSSVRAVYDVLCEGYKNPSGMSAHLDKTYLEISKQRPETFKQMQQASNLKDALTVHQGTQRIARDNNLPGIHAYTCMEVDMARLSLLLEKNQSLFKLYSLCLVSTAELATLTQEKGLIFYKDLPVSADAFVAMKNEPDFERFIKILTTPETSEETQAWLSSVRVNGKDLKTLGQDDAGKQPLITRLSLLANPLTKLYQTQYSENPAGFPFPEMHTFFAQFVTYLQKGTLDIASQGLPEEEDAQEGALLALLPGWQNLLDVATTALDSTKADMTAPGTDSEQAPALSQALYHYIVLHNLSWFCLDFTGDILSKEESIETLKALRAKAIGGLEELKTHFAHTMPLFDLSALPSDLTTLYNKNAPRTVIQKGFQA